MCVGTARLYSTYYISMCVGTRHCQIVLYSLNLCVGTRYWTFTSTFHKPVSRHCQVVFYKYCMCVGTDRWYSRNLCVGTVI